MKASMRLRMLAEDKLDKFNDQLIYLNDNNFNVIFIILTFFILSLIFMTNLIL